jgi:hypothetical protein
MLAQSKDVQFLHSVIAHPDVLPWVTLGRGALDLTDVVGNPENIFLANEYGGFLFIRDGDNYEVHTQFLPQGRGRKAVEAAREAAWHIFTRTPALAIRTYVPRGNFRAAALARRAGFSAWGTVNNDGIEMDWYVLTIKEWAKGLKQCQQH